MEKIAILCCGKIAANCSGKGCKKAFKERKDAFSNYPAKNVKLITLIRCLHCDDQNASKVLKKMYHLSKKGIRTIHLSSCIFSVCERYPDFLVSLSEQFIVINGTHGLQNDNH